MVSTNQPQFKNSTSHPLRVFLVIDTSAIIINSETYTTKLFCVRISVGCQVCPLLIRLISA